MHSVKKESYLTLFLLVSRVNETLKWCHKVNQTHSPVLSSLGQKSARLPYLKKVQHPNEKSKAKKRFRQSNQGSSESLFMWKKFLDE